MVTVRYFLWDLFSVKRAEYLHFDPSQKNFEEVCLHFLQLADKLLMEQEYCDFNFSNQPKKTENAEINDVTVFWVIKSVDRLSFSTLL